MGRPELPKAEDVVEIAKALRAEGFEGVIIETHKGGGVSIRVGRDDQKELTTLEKWQRKYGTS